MGRIDTNATHPHQGLEFQEIHQTPAETIDDAPPPDEDLYEPPPDYQPESAGVINNKPAPPPPQAFPPPSSHEPQPFPPPHHHLAAVVHSFPPPHHQDHDEPLTPQPFPPRHDNHIQSFPPHQDHDNPLPQPFPRPQEQTAQPNFPQNNQYVHQHQSVGMHFPAQQAFPQKPVGGIPVGVSPSPLIPQQTQPWKTHLFDCMKNPKNAIITLLFPCVTFGQIAEILDSGSTSCGTSGMLYSLIACCIAMPCIMSCTYRTKLRSKFGLIESPAPDWLIHCFCEYCALCQEYRELEQRGFDPSIGYSGNVARQQQMVQQFGMTPPMQQRMI